MKLLKKRYMALFTFLVMLISLACPVSAGDFEGSLYARGAVLLDADSGRVLYEKDGYEVMPMASTTKIMTCILALEYGNMDDLCAASSYAASAPQVHIGVTAGEEYRLEDLLYSLMLESHNDAAIIIAEHIAGSTQAFADMMNQKARDIGCTDTFFITPNGLDATATDVTGDVHVHSTTASDLAQIMRYCIKISPKLEDFLTITRTISYTFTDSSEKRTVSCTNHNSFLSMMEGALSGKTGFTNDAGYCYVGALERDGKTFIVALLGCGWPNNKSYKWSDTRKLMEYGLAEYEYRDVYVPVEFEDILVEEGVPISGDLSETAYTGVKLSDTAGSLEVLLRSDESVDVQFYLPDSLSAPVSAGAIVGTVKYMLNGETIAELPVVIEEDVEEISYSWSLQSVTDELFSFSLPF